MELKTVVIEGVTYAAVQDGKPVYTEGGKDIAFDAVGTRATITRLNGEAQGHRERAETAETSLKAFAGIADPAAAAAALETVKSLDAGKLQTAEAVQKRVDEAVKAVEERFKPIVEKATKLEGDLYEEKITGAFSRSPLIVGEKAKFAIPADLVQSRFGQNFKIEEGKVVAYDQNGSKVFSKSNPGNLADFDEALELIVDAYPHKDSILKGKVGAGGGAGNGGTVLNGQDLAAMTPTQKMNIGRQQTKAA